MSDISEKLYAGSVVTRYRFFSMTTLGFVWVTAMLLLAITTYSIITGLTQITIDESILNRLILVNIVSIILTLIPIGLQINQLLRARKLKTAGAGLLSRGVMYFTAVSAVPAILVAIFASFTLSEGLDSYFSSRVKKVIDNSLVVANLYNEAHAASIWDSAQQLAQEVNRIYPIYKNSIEKNPEAKKIFEDFLSTQVLFKQLDGALIWDFRQDKIVVQFNNFPQNTFPRPEDSEVLQAGTEGILKIKKANKSLILVYLESFDQFLYVYKNINPAVTEQLLNANRSREEYLALNDLRDEVELSFALMYVGVGLTLIMAAIWISFQVVNRLISPIRRLMNAAQMVSDGQFEVVLPIHKSEGDLSELSRTFNNMTKKLTDQRDDLVDASKSIDARNRFNEAMLSGVSAGVIGLDTNQKITLLNGPAEKLFGIVHKDAVENHLETISPELNEVFDKQFISGLSAYNGQIILTIDNQERIVNFRITEEISGDHNEGYVITLDDITDLVSAQRTSAWADIARRIAHEIKNPLTPIQLSAERLKRKYRKDIKADDTIFDKCIDTIVRQVGDIGNMVDEFASFAKMPSAKLENGNIIACIKEAVFLQKVGNPDIEIIENLPSEKHLQIDRRLITQVITNIIKNATESIDAALSDNLIIRGEGHGKIIISTTQKDKFYEIYISDNGVGLPKFARHKLLEPYITSRSKGTGLGLAIVKRIMEEHGGNIELGDAPTNATYSHGAMVTLRFPIINQVLIKKIED